VCGTIEQVGVAGQYDFSSFPGFVLAGTVRLKWRGCAVISFLFSLVSCHSSWRVDMRGRDIALFAMVFCSGFLRIIYGLMIVDNLLQEVSEDSAP
jgi:hypothetical protein